MQLVVVHFALYGESHSSASFLDLLETILTLATVQVFRTTNEVMHECKNFLQKLFCGV